MTRKVFWQDAYLTELDATITTVKGSDILVDQTIFFAQSGGQESDHGCIGGCRVLHARKDGKEIVYTLESDHGCGLGSE